MPIAGNTRNTPGFPQAGGPVGGGFAPASGQRSAEPPAGPAAGPAGPGRAVPRLLADLPPRGSWQTLAEHRQHYPAPPVARSKPWTTFIDAVQQAGLRGRGGAGFPTAVKMRSVAAGRGRPVVVANGTEGEPASYKDRFLLTTLPHLVLDGAQLAAAAVGADRILLGVDRTSRGALTAVRRALAERAAAEPGSLPVELVETPPGYVTGEETALVHFLNGGEAKPTVTPPRPYEKGVGRRPTLIQNVETLAHLTQIARSGAGWFRTAGTPDEPGTMLITISGAVANPGVIEIPLGTPLEGIIQRAGPTVRPMAALVGGFFGAWVPAQQFGFAFSRAGLGPTGASVGAGIVVVLPEGACGMAETARIMQWYADESAGQCGPCIFGLPAMAKEAAAVVHGPVPREGIARLQRWAADVEGRGACKHPDGSVRLMRSALKIFGADLDRHLRGQPCPGSFAAPVIHVASNGPRYPVR